MSEHDILSQLTDLIRQVFDNNKIVLTPKTTADDVPEWDSFNHISLVAAVEAHFKIKFQTAEIEELKNVDDFIKAIEHKVSAKA